MSVVCLIYRAQPKYSAPNIDCRRIRNTHTDATHSHQPNDHVIAEALLPRLPAIVREWQYEMCVREKEKKNRNKYVPIPPCADCRELSAHL